VEYKRLFSFGNFSNETIGFRASIDENEDAISVLDHLKNLAELTHTRYEEKREVEKLIRYANSELDMMKYRLENYDEEYDKQNKQELMMSITQKQNEIKMLEKRLENL